MAETFPRLLTGLTLHNFRAFKDESVDFGPITVLVGPNNAGKSSILSAITILAQTLGSFDSEVPLLLGSFGTFRDVAFHNNVKRTVGVKLSLLVDKLSASVEAYFQYRAQRREIILSELNISDQDYPLFQTSYSKDSEQQVIKYARDVADDFIKYIRPRFVNFMPRVLTSRFELEKLSADRPDQVKKALSTLHRVDSITREAGRLLSLVQYLGPFREVPSRLYPFAGERPSSLDSTGHGATDILVADYFRRGTRKRELSNMVQGWLTQAKIANELQVVAVGDRHYEIKLQHPISREFENIADIGYGVSQILPVIVAGYNSEPHSIFAVEQPEIHLHPKAQAELGDFFLQLYEKGVQCIVETHSEHLLMRLQTHVARGKISSDDLVVNYVEPGPSGKSVVRLPLDEDGIFTRDWPEGFFEERLHEATELAAAPLKRRGEI
jgi:putative AbiEii toxin of type IV toxin-antitoxin system